MSIRFYYNLWKLYRWYKGGMKGMDTTKWKSRKLIMTLVGTVVVTLLNQAGVEESIVKTIGMIFVTYLGAQGVADVMANHTK